MTENSKKVLEFLKKHYGKEFTKHEIVDRIDITMAAVTGSVNAFLNKGYVTERVEILPARYRGEKDLEIKYVTLTEAGYKFDPDEEERRKAQERLELSAARREARRLEKAERARINSVL